MNILEKNTPLKIKHVIIGGLIIIALFFCYSTWRQVQRNAISINAIVNFLNQNAKPAPPVKAKPPIEEKQDVQKD